MGGYRGSPHSFEENAEAGADRHLSAALSIADLRAGARADFSIRDSREPANAAGGIFPQRATIKGIR
jgi:hypothetical protein